MSLKSLTFSSIPHKSVDPTIRRRERLVEKLQEQLQLALETTNEGLRHHPNDQELLNLRGSLIYDLTTQQKE